MSLSPPPAQPPAGSPPLPVLVVEDDPLYREIIQGALEDEGISVRTAATGLQALERASLDRPALVVLDVRLPELDGHQVAERLRAEGSADLPILLITADGHAAQKARQAGAYAYLSKPFELEDLLQAVRKGLALAT